MGSGEGADQCGGDWGEDAGPGADAERKEDSMFVTAFANLQRPHHTSDDWGEGDGPQVGWGARSENKQDKNIGGSTVYSCGRGYPASAVVGRRIDRHKGVEFKSDMAGDGPIDGACGKLRIADSGGTRYMLVSLVSSNKTRVARCESRMKKMLESMPYLADDNIRAQHLKKDEFFVERIFAKQYEDLAWEAKKVTAELEALKSNEGKMQRRNTIHDANVEKFGSSAANRLERSKMRAHMNRRRTLEAELRDENALAARMKKREENLEKFRAGKKESNEAR